MTHRAGLYYEECSGKASIGLVGEAPFEEAASAKAVVVLTSRRKEGSLPLSPFKRENYDLLTEAGSRAWLREFNFSTPEETEGPENIMTEARCPICNCLIHRNGDYARPSIKGRSHATQHHYVAERFFGRSATRRGTQREPIFSSCPWNMPNKTVVLCYDCHEELVHNPVFLPVDISDLALLVKSRGLQEDEKTDNRDKLGARIELLHEVIEIGLRTLLNGENKGAPMETQVLKPVAEA